MQLRTGITRRGFLRGAACGIAAGLILRGASGTQAAPVQLGLTHGDDRAANVYNALKLIEPQVREGLARKKTVLIKPNMVAIDRQLAATHADCLEGILEFLSPLVDGEILIAESPANGPAMEGYDNYGYPRLTKEYRARLVDMDAEPYQTEYLVDERHHARAVRFSSLVLDPDVYLISAAVFKTHDRAVVTLGLKNVVAGALLKDSGYRWGPNSRGSSDKHYIHGGPENQGIHFNMFTLARRAAPCLTVLDGFEGMEHNGPTAGTPVDHRVALAGTDWLAADRVAAELMGFDWRKVGYLSFAADAGMGETSLDKLEILGERMADRVRAYHPHDTIEKQYQWM